MNSKKVAVVGAGAAGLMAAGAAAEQGASVTLIEKNPRVGRKIMITGKGRCNILNNCDVPAFIANVPVNGRFLYSAVNRFSPADAYAFFEGIGLPLKTERGNRCFPQSDRAVDVVDAQHPLMIPGDSTYPSWFNALYQQHGLGYMHESEGSVITDIWGASVMSYNTALRKAAEHEVISKNRVMTGKMVIERPKFSMLLTGTFDQYKKLVPSVENGYFSRLLTLFVQSTYPFDKKYVTTISVQSAIPEKIGNKLLDLHELMSMDEEKEWTLTQEQKEMLGEHLETEYKTLIMMLGENFHSTVVRMAVQIERIAMILSAMRGNLEVCSDEDFLTALMIGNKLLQHMAMAYKLINGDAQRAVPDIKPLDQRRILYKQLKEEYDRKTLIDEAKVQGISERTAERWNNAWMEVGQVEKLSHGQYRKVA